MEYNNTYGFESNVEFIITISGVVYVIGILDFQRAVTDGLTYFECSVIQESRQALLKRRSDIKVDMFSSVDLDGNVILPLSTQDLFLPGTTLIQQSRWSATNSFARGLVANFEWNHINAIQISDIEDTLSFFIATTPNPEFLRYIEAQNDLFEIVLSLSDFTLNQSFTFTQLLYRIGTDFSTATEVTLEDFANADLFNYSNSWNLPDIRRGEFLWVYFRSGGVGINAFDSPAGASFNITTNATPISTVTPAISIQDIIEQVILSISGMATLFSPDFLTVTADERCFNGLGLRGFDPDNFYISFDDIKSWLQELNADYQIIDNNTVFVGFYADFYTDFLVGSNTVAPNAEFKRTYNPRYTINEFSYKYDKFEDDKNTENNRALNSIHTNSQWNLPNTQVENKKDIEISFIRDFALIETVRRFNSLASNSESTKNDEDIFIVNIDPTLPPAVNNYNFNSFVTVDGGFVTFTNNNEFSFIATGLNLGTLVTFDADNGAFTAVGNVVIITPSVITINDFGVSGIVDGQYLVNFTFTVFGVTARTNQGFTAINNDGADGEGFVNIVFSPKRNILQYWGAYLNTACNFVQAGTIRNTFFISNATFSSDYTADGLGLVEEGADIPVSTLNDRLLTPYIIETVIIVDFSEFQSIVELLRAERGYLEIADNNGNVIGVYPQLLDYNWELNALRVIGEERF